jgi:hypothetical protein
MAAISAAAVAGGPAACGAAPRQGAYAIVVIASKANAAAVLLDRLIGQRETEAKMT